MKNNTFVSPIKIITEQGGISRVGEIAAGYGKKALVCIGGGSVKREGYLEKLQSSLAGAGMDFTLYEGIKSDPDIEAVLEGVQICKSNSCDFVVALGGGSVIDAAKAIGLLANNPGDLVTYEKTKPEKPMLPLIAIPTTAGTGSEVTSFSIITDNAQKRKLVISWEEIMPNVALLDVDLTVSMPSSIAAATGMDAVTHAIESYLSDRASMTTRLFALKAIELISANIHSASYNPKNLEAKEAMLIGQMYAGLAFSNTSTALVHSMSRPLGVYYGVPHGEGNAVLLATVMKFNLPACKKELADMAKAVGLCPEDKSDGGYAKAFVAFIEETHFTLPLRRDLKDLNITEQDVEEMSKIALAAGSTGVNPRKPSLEEIKMLFKKLM